MKYWLLRFLSFKFIYFSFSKVWIETNTNFMVKLFTQRLRTYFCRKTMESSFNYTNQSKILNKRTSVFETGIKLKSRLSRYIKLFYFLDMSAWASAGVGRAGIAPFWVVQSAPHAFAKLKATFSFPSSWTYNTKF